MLTKSGVIPGHSGSHDKLAEDSRRYKRFKYSLCTPLGEGDGEGGGGGVIS